MKAESLYARCHSGRRDRPTSRGIRTAWVKPPRRLQPMLDPSVHDIMTAFGDTDRSECCIRETNGKRTRRQRAVILISRMSQRGTLRSLNRLVSLYLDLEWLDFREFCFVSDAVAGAACSES